MCINREGFVFLRVDFNRAFGDYSIRRGRFLRKMKQYRDCFWMFGRLSIIYANRYTELIPYTGRKKKSLFGAT